MDYRLKLCSEGIRQGGNVWTGSGQPDKEMFSVVISVKIVSEVLNYFGALILEKVTEQPD